MTKKERSLLISLVVLVVVWLSSLAAGQSTSTPSSVTTVSETSPTVSSATTAAQTPAPNLLTAETTSPSAKLHQVIKVIDGDTIKVDVDGKIETVRLVGIDTPETVDPRRPVECMGMAASNFAKALLEDRLVRLETDSTQGDRDRYGRLLRFVFLQDGTDVGKLLLLGGYAQESLYSSKPHKYRSAYVEAEQQARAQQLGLWNSAICPVDAR